MTARRARVAKRYPMQALADAARLELQQMAKALGVSGSTWKEYRDLGMSELVADRMAAKLGLAAYSVWPEMLDDVIAETEADRRRRRAEAQRRWRRNNPESAERERARRRAYYQECGEAERARERRRYHENRDRERARMKAYRERMKEAG